MNRELIEYYAVKSVVAALFVLYCFNDFISDWYVVGNGVQMFGYAMPMWLDAIMTGVLMLGGPVIIFGQKPND